MFGFKEEEFFEVEEAIREGGPPQVNFTEPGPAVSFEGARGSESSVPPAADPAASDAPHPTVPTSSGAASARRPTARAGRRLVDRTAGARRTLRVSSHHSRRPRDGDAAQR